MRINIASRIDPRFEFTNNQKRILNDVTPDNNERVLSMLSKIIAQISNDWHNHASKDGISRNHGVFKYHGTSWNVWRYHDGTPMSVNPVSDNDVHRLVSFVKKSKRRYRRDHGRVSKIKGMDEHTIARIAKSIVLGMSQFKQWVGENFKPVKEPKVAKQIIEKVAKHFLRNASKRKIKKFFYEIDGYYLVQTQKYGNDKAYDWVAVKNRKLAESIWNGDRFSNHDILWVGNRLRDFKPEDVDE